MPESPSLGTRGFSYGKHIGLPFIHLLIREKPFQSDDAGDAMRLIHFGAVSQRSSSSCRRARWKPKYFMASHAPCARPCLRSRSATGPPDRLGARLRTPALSHSVQTAARNGRLSKWNNEASVRLIWFQSSAPRAASMKSSPEREASGGSRPRTLRHSSKSAWSFSWESFRLVCPDMGVAAPAPGLCQRALSQF